MQNAQDDGLDNVDDLESPQFVATQVEYAGDPQWVGGIGKNILDENCGHADRCAFIPEAGELLVLASFQDTKALRD